MTVASTDVVRSAIEAGSPSIGMCQILPGVMVAEKLGKAGFPWVLVDLQHGGCEMSDLMGVLLALERGGTAALVRPRSTEPAEIMRVLDMGALGVVLPMVGSADEARRIVTAAHYPPLGQRSLGPLREAYGGAGGAARPLVFPMIETMAGVDATEEIAAIDGVDGLVVGPGDMALSLGEPLTALPGPGVMGVARRVVEACRRHGKIPGAFAFTDGALEAFLDTGMMLLPFGADALMLTEMTQQKLKVAQALSTGRKA